MRVNASVTGVVIPGLVAGVIYFVIAIATGASAVASIVGGIVVAAIAAGIGFIFRAVYKRRAAGTGPTCRWPIVCRLAHPCNVRRS
jgi:hypothetical protein